MVENGRAQSIIQIEHADLIRWQDHMSPTKIGNMIEYPFDFLMGDLLRITTDGDAQMPDVKTTQGNVAHAIIEALFSPTEGKRYADANEIKDRINNGFEDVYRQTIEAKGAILHLAENKLTEQLFHEQLSHCLNVLLTILEDNELRVTGCESPIECNLRLGLPKAISKDG